ncbi:MAG: TRAP transporter small permease [Pasteurellaceae bacterium]|nr:TRAP transporter small permease [Pasteurellaceae bacterium]
MKTLKSILNFSSIVTLLVMILLVFFNAILRYFFHSGIAWSEEFARICFVYMIFLGIILVSQEKGHLTVDIIISSLPEQYKKIALIITNLLNIIASIFITYGAYQLMYLTSDQNMPATGIPSSILYIAAIISFLSYIIISLFELIANIRK